MPADSETQSIHASQAGKMVIDRLNLPSYSGKVLSVVSNAIYLLGQDDEVLWLTNREPMHDRAILVTPLPHGGSPQSPFKFASSKVLFETNVIDISKVTTWNPSPHQNLSLLASQEVLDRCKRVFLKIRLSPPPKGFGTFLAQISELFDHETLTNPGFPANDAILVSAREPVFEICHTCKAGDLTHLLHHCSRLIGLGYGLTPSGDDFVGGLIYTLEIIQSLGRLEHGLIREDLETFIQSRQFKTNIISFCILKDMCAGSASGAIHSFVNDLLFNPSASGIDESLVNLIQIGHSTGWDVLTGILSACLCFTFIKVNKQNSEEREFHGT